VAVEAPAEWVEPEPAPGLGANAFAHRVGRRPPTRLGFRATSSRVPIAERPW